jgi:beta-galactosidase
MDGCWSGVLDHPSVIGDFTWTGWDYLGEAGVGRTEYPASDPDAAEPSASFHGAYPWLTAGCSDIDIIGDRQPQSYYREILFGLAVGPAIFVQPPQRHGIAPVHSGPWSWPDVLRSWTWDGFEGRPIQVEVYADADEVELILNGTSQGRQPVGIAGRRHAAIFEPTFEPGTLEAVAFREGAEIGRSQLVTATSDLQLLLAVEAQELRGDGTDLAFVAISMVDANGTRHPSRDRAVTISLEGPAVLQAFGSANPSTTELFTNATHTTYRGRAMAMVRPTGAGTIKVTASADGCQPVTAECVAKP